MSGWLLTVLPFSFTSSVLLVLGTRRLVLAVVTSTFATFLFGLTTAFSASDGMPPDTPMWNDFRVERLLNQSLQSTFYGFCMSVLTGVAIWYGKLEWDIWQSRGR